MRSAPLTDDDWCRWDGHFLTPVSRLSVLHTNYRPDEPKGPWRVYLCLHWLLFQHLGHTCPGDHIGAPAPGNPHKVDVSDNGEVSGETEGGPNVGTTGSSVKTTFLHSRLECCVAYRSRVCFWRSARDCRVCENVGGLRPALSVCTMHAYSNINSAVCIARRRG